MAASLAQPKKKRKRKETQRKLLVGEDVEVRSTEEGFHGSWHPATVIQCDELVRLVRYKHLLVDSGDDEFLTESIDVSPMIEGDVSNYGVTVNYRGLIRPVPPPFKFTCWGLSYGLCVDAFVNDAWWEGVIFDYEDGLNERLVFFPDLGDQQKVKIDNLRVTHDWAEVTEEWNMRGDWLFLELIERQEREKELYASVSARQLWYDVKAKEAFRLSVKEWTCWMRPMWDDLVVEVISDNINLTADHFLTFIESEDSKTTRSSSIMSDTALPCEGILQGHVEDNHFASTSPGPSKRTRSRSSNRFDSTLHREGCLQDNVGDNKLASTPLEEARLKLKADSSDIHNKTKKVNGSSEVKLGGQIDKSASLKLKIVKDSNGRAVAIKRNLGLSDVRMEDSDCHQMAITLREVDVDPICTSLHSNPDPFTPNSSVTDDRLDLRDNMPKDQVGRVVQDVLVNYLRIAKANPKMPCGFEKSRVRDEVRGCLMDMGWRIHCYKDSSKLIRTHIVSPEGKIFYSLIKACEYLTETKGHLTSQCFPEILQQHCRTEGYSAIPLGEAMAPDHFKRETGVHSVVSPRTKPLLLNISKQKGSSAEAGSIREVEPEYCPQAVLDLYGLGERPKNVRDLREKARKHLSYMGWTFWLTTKKNKVELRYTSPPPNSKVYTSLRTACRGCLEQELVERRRPVQRVIINEESKGEETCGNLSSTTECTKGEDHLMLENMQSGKSYKATSGWSQSREFEFGNIEVKGVRAARKRRKDNSFPFAIELLHSNVKASSSDTRQDRALHAVSFSKPKGLILSVEQKKRKKARALTRKADSLFGSCPSRLLRSNKRARQVVASNPAHFTPRTILSWLIENNVVLPREKVFYKRKNEPYPLAEGRITRDGIKCNCCQKVYGVSSFEFHAGSTYRRPAASIFLEDGRSLLDCQKEIVHDSKLSSCTSVPYQRIKNDIHHVNNDCICTICHYGGNLVLCDQCPSSFHLSCIGLRNLPKGKWFCPSCRCGICGQSEFNANTEQFTDKTVLYCDQCEREYHVGCLRKGKMAMLDFCPKENWFCGETCKKIFMGLHKILGKPIAAGVDNLSWSILKFSKDGYDGDLSNTETMAEHHSKLNVALAVMHECFEPIKEPQTKDLVKDVIFNKRSVLKRLDFRGFYTVLLEKGDELISVATVRIYGGKVAEVPLVATRVQYRRQGMCRILMNLLEKKLAKFGVQRLLLPAIPQLLQAWTTTFGFSRMTDSERLEFLEYTFLDFQDTTMCQKVLNSEPTMEVTVPRANQHGSENELNLSYGDVTFDRAAKVAKQDEQSGILIKRPLKVTAGDDCSLDKDSSPVITTTPPLWCNYESCLPEKQEDVKGSKTKEFLTYCRRKKNTRDNIRPNATKCA